MSHNVSLQQQAACLQRRGCTVMALIFSDPHRQSHNQEVSLTHSKELIYSEVEVGDKYRRGQLAMLLC